jgi:hypothetical protein
MLKCEIYHICDTHNTHTSLQAYIILRVGLNFLNTYKKI